MAETKKCPMTYGVEKGAYDQEISGFDPCIGKECGFWIDDTISGRTAICAIPLLALRLDEVAHFKRKEASQ